MTGWNVLEALAGGLIGSLVVIIPMVIIYRRWSR